MEKSFLLLNPHGRKMCCGAETAGLIALGGLGALSGIYGASTASSNNAAMLSANKEMQKDAQRWNEKMYQQQLADQESMYNKYQSPQAIADQLRQAGLNPSALASGGLQGGSMPSVPSVGSSPALSAPSLENQGAYVGKAIESTASALSSLSSAHAQNVEAEKTRSMLQEQMRGLMLQNNQTELANNYQAMVNYLKETFGEQEVSAQIQDLVSRSYLNYMSGDTQQALKGYHDIMTKVAGEEFKIKSEQAANIATYLNKLLLNMEQDYNLKGQQIKTGKSEMVRNYSIANYHDELSKTENGMRSGRIEMQSLSNDLLTLDKFLQGNALALSDKTLQSQIVSIIEQAKQAQLITDQEVEKLYQLQKGSSWFERQQFADYCGKFIGALSSAVGAAGSYYGSTLQRLTGKERNAIRERFVQEMERQGSYKRSYNGYPEGYGSRPDWFNIPAGQ